MCDDDDAVLGGQRSFHLVHKAENLASDVALTGLDVIEDSLGGGEDDESKLTRGEEVVDPLLNVVKLHVIAGGDDAGLVDAPKKVDHNLVGAVIIDDLKFSDVSCFRRPSRVEEKKGVRKTMW